MNLLKIFTYGGIIEVFVVPHILPCVMGFIPAHINDMIQLGISLISSLFPHITINVQSEVFLKVWKDGKEGAEAAELRLPSLPDFKSDSPASSESGGGGASPSGSSSPDSGSGTGTGTGFGTGFGRSNDCRPCDLGGGSLRPKDVSTTRPPSSGPKPAASKDADAGGGCLERCQRFADHITVAKASASPPSLQCHPLAYMGNATASLLSERSDLFARSCSAEYQVRQPTSVDERVDLLLRSGATTVCSSCDAEQRSNDEREHPSFVKSCSLEYATVLEAQKESRTADDDDRTVTSVADVESRLVSKGLHKEVASENIAIATPEVKWKSTSSKLVDANKKVLAKKSLLNAALSDEPKPIYFGDNFQNL